MTQFFAAFEDFFKSIFELIASLVGTVLNIFQGVINAVLAFLTGIVNLITDTFSAAVSVVGGLGQFVVGNIVILSIVGVVAYLYFNGQRRAPVTVKKTN